jgi:hypothetical protein
MKKLVFVLFVMACIGMVYADMPISISITPENAIYNYLYPSNFNPDEPQSQPILFNINITNHSQEPLNYEFSFRFLWAGNTLIDNVVIRPVNNEPINPGQNIMLNNRDIFSSQGSFFTSVGYNFDDFLSENPDFEDIVLSTGLLPDGQYICYIKAFEYGSENTVDDNENELSALKTFSFTINIPISISLISPGNPLSFGPEQIQNYHPQFIWLSNLSNYHLKIYEIDGSIPPADEIEQYQPYFEMENLTSNVLAYPNDAPPLVDNQIYAWQVYAEVSNPAGSSDPTMKSPIYLFQPSITSQQTSATNQALINFLQQMSGEDLSDLIDLLQSGYYPENIEFGNMNISVQELYDLLISILLGEIEIEGIEIE